MLATRGNEFLLEISTPAGGTQPSANWGTAVTPAQNAYGSYVQLLSGATITDDCYEIDIEISSAGSSTNARDAMVTIGFDPAGGTTYADKIVDLVCGPAVSHVAGALGGVGYRFPLFVKGGTSIAAKAAVNSATLTAFRVACTVRGRPTNLEAHKFGTHVVTFGANLATSAGTALTPGTAAEGAWTQIGSALTEVLWYWEFGYGINDATMTSSTIHVDIGIGDATNKRVVIKDAVVASINTEAMAKPLGAGRFARAAIGDLVYARAQSSSTPDDNNSVAVYAVGG